MKFVVGLGVALWGCSLAVLPASAQPAPVDEAPASTAADLTLPPRLGGGVSTSGSGVPRFTHLETWVPVWQEPGQALTFVEARLLWLDYATLGTNVVLGQRLFDAAGDRVFGGYVAYDTRDTGNHRFHQLGLGVERLSEAWELRLNGSFPLGETRPAVGAPTTVSETVQLSALQFQGHALLASGQRTVRQRQAVEAALFTLEGEAGGKLFDLGDLGQVRGYGGLYYLGATRTAALGWRARLEAQVLDQYLLGLALQNDAVFGTNAIASVRVRFGGGAPALGDRRSQAKLGASVARNSTILVASQEETRTFTEALEAQVARNPATGEPWFFQHIGNTGADRGNGTFENPFGTVAAGLSAASSNSIDNRNEIVYVQLGNNPGIPGFTIPDNLQVLSTGPSQSLATTEFGSVQLPLSGTGQRPTVTNTVVMGNNTVLSGFTITGFADHGIDARNRTEFTIRNNTISDVTLFGIFGGVNNGSTVGNIRVENNTFSNVGNGANRHDAIFFGVDNGSTLQNLTIANNTINNAGNDGIGLGARAGSTLINVMVMDNTINTVGRFGIGVGADTPVTPLLLGATNNSRINNIIIDGNRISNAGQNSTVMLPGASIGVAIQANNSRACFRASGNTSIAPNNLFGGVANLDLYLQNTGGVAANLQIINRGALGTGNLDFDVIRVFTPLPNLLPSLTSDVASC